MKGLIFSNNVTDSYEAQRLILEFKKRNIRVYYINPSNIDIFVNREDRKSILVNNEFASLPDFVIPRLGSSMNYYQKSVIRHLEKMGVLIINGSESIENAKDKLYSMQILAQQNIPVPKTLLAKDPVNIEYIKRRIGFPVVVKTLSGTHGKGVYLAKDETNLQQLLDMISEINPRMNLIIQEFVSAQAGTDIRVFVVGGKVVGAMKRESKDGDFRANVSRGAIPSNFEVDYDAEYLALESSKLLHLDIAGVDLLIDEEGYKICEVNSAPGFQGLESATNINIAQAIVNYVLHRIAVPSEK